jgi:hypothetical protein
MMYMPDCVCFKPAYDYRDYVMRSIGIDPTNHRFGDVSILICQHCGAKWLFYQVEYEAFTASGRWFRGLLTDDAQAAITPPDAIPLLEQLPWYFAGGSYFQTIGKRSSGKISLDLFQGPL